MDGNGFFTLPLCPTLVPRLSHACSMLVRRLAPKRLVSKILRINFLLRIRDKTRVQTQLTAYTAHTGYGFIRPRTASDAPLCFRGLLFFYGVVVQVYAGYALNLLAEHKTRAWTSNKFVDISPALRLVGTPDGQQVPRRPCVHVLKVGGFTYQPDK